MMLKYIAFADVNDEHLKAIAKALVVVPEEVRHAAKDIIQALAVGAFTLFEFHSGLLLVHKDSSRLVIDAMTADIWKRKELADALKKLAADYMCDTVQTTVFDKRLADAIVAIGGSIESYDIILAVG